MMQGRRTEIDPLIGAVMKNNSDNTPAGRGGDNNPPPPDPSPGAPKPKRQFGAMRGQFEIGPEFFEPLPPDELDEWCQG
jgi:hypothetical protein